MSVSATLEKILTPLNGSPVRASETTTSGAFGVNISEAIPANQTNLPVAGAFANAKLKAFYAYSDVDMSVYTNEASSGTPQEKINLKAGRLYHWTLTDSFLGEVGDSAASPFDGDVSGFFVTNTTAGQLTIIAIVDPT